MKWAKQAGLVSCDTEAKLIVKLDKELSCKKANKHKHKRKRKVKHNAKNETM